MDSLYIESLRAWHAEKATKYQELARNTDPTVPQAADAFTVAAGHHLNTVQILAKFQLLFAVMNDNGTSQA
jgi:hypothetical protein